MDNGIDSLTSLSETVVQCKADKAKFPFHSMVLALLKIKIVRIMHITYHAERSRERVIVRLLLIPAR